MRCAALLGAELISSPDGELGEKGPALSSADSMLRFLLSRSPGRTSMTAAQI